MQTNTSLNLRNIIDIIIRLGILAGLMIWCFQILLPFLSPVIWGLLLAVLLYPFYTFLLQRFKNNRKLSAIIIVLVILSVIIIPSYLFVGSMVEGVQTIGTQMEEGEFKIPPPTQNVQEWPLVGPKVYDAWSMASDNIDKLLDQYNAQIAGIGKFMLNSLIDTGIGVFQFILAIIIAAILLATSSQGVKFMEKLFRKVVGERADEFAKISALTIKNVAKGILGVAGIQSIMAGIGFLLAGVPFAGLWAILCLILAIIQLGPALVIIPVIIYLYSTASPLAATLWTIYLVIVMVSDNILKPILLGKGAPVPMLIIFLGSIG